MTLNEYITQSEPQANVKVILQEGEYIQRDAIKVAPFSVHTAVDIPAIAELTRFLRFLKANEVFLKQWCEAHPVRGDLQECNARFRTAYAEYLNSIRNTYALTDEDIDFWLF